MKHLLLISMALITHALWAQDIDQSALTTAGNSKSQSGRFLDWTIGQNFSTTQTNGTVSLAAGIHQPKLVTETLQVLKAINPNIRVYPNPVVNLLQVEPTDTESLTLTLTDLNGKVLISATDNKTLDLSELSNGIYLLTIRTEEYTSQHKIIKN